jgi:hypothetical protein
MWIYLSTGECQVTMLLPRVYLPWVSFRWIFDYFSLEWLIWLGKGPSQPAPKFVGNLLAFILNLVKKTLEQFFDWHTQHEKHNNIFVSWIFFLCSDRSKGYWICTIFAWLSYHSELFIRKSVVGKGKVSRIIYLCPASVWCKSMICSYCWNINGCRADRHMPTYAKKIVDMYNKNGEIEKMLSEKWL